MLTEATQALKLFLKVAVLAVVMLIGVSGTQFPGGCGTEAQGMAIGSLASATMSSWAENHSYSTTCAEEDNVNVPLFSREPIPRYRVVATHPTYNIGVDNCAPDFSGCSSSSSSSGSESGDSPSTLRPAQANSCTTLWDDGITVSRSQWGLRCD